MITEIITTMRPNQWYKNLVIFAGIVFSLNIANLHMWRTVLLSFVVFCMLSASEYIINDVLDKGKDRTHPEKRNRPIASGRLNSRYALVVSAVLIAVALLGSYLVAMQFLVASVGYLVLVSLYSAILKNIAVLDVLAISIGFVIRALAGCVAIDVVISPWLIVCSFLLALYLALGKRRCELDVMGRDADHHREAIKDFSFALIDQMVTMVGAAVVTAYSLYTFLSGEVYLMATIPLVIYALFRYMYLIQKGDLEKAELLTHDKAMVTCLVLWVLMIVFILYV